jgi:Uma2 family endonuclease
MAQLLHSRPLLFAPGDRMDRDEFLSRWERMPDVKFAELIDGTVYMPSPVTRDHTRLDGQMMVLLSHYVARTQICELMPNGTWHMLESAPQPDIALALLPEHGGRNTTVDGYAHGVPELVVEVTHSSRAYDLGPKLALYQRAGVPEYLAVLIEEQRVEWRVLDDGGSYGILKSDAQGIYCSKVFPGLWLNEPAYWARDVAAMLKTLDEGLANT